MAQKPTYQELEQRVQKLEKAAFERQLEEKALQEQVVHHRVLMDVSLDGIAIIDQRHRVVESNKRFAEMLGYTQEEVLSLHTWDWEAIMTEAGIRSNFADLTKTKATFETRHRRRDGTIYDAEVTACGAKLGDEPMVLTITRDITERKQAEEALRHSEERYRTILEDMEEGYYEVDLAGNFTFFNDSMARIGGYSKDEFIGSNYREYLDEETVKKVYRLYNEVYTTERPVKNLKWEIQKKDGSKGYLEVSASLLKDSEGKTIGLRGVARDVTEPQLAKEERTRLENQLHRAQKMESLGLMAGSVAHDLNNILSGIVSYPELFLMDLPEESPLRKPIKTIQESGMKAAEVVAELLTIARGVATGKEALNLNTLVSEYLGSPEYQELERTHSFVDFRTELDPDLLNMNGSPTHIKKVLTNLVTNASEAIEVSGTVTLSTENRYVDEPFKGYEDVREGEYAVLSVSDEGTGISQKDLERIFEPFYTKKVMGRSGTGLGLAVVWNTVQDHNGYINVNTSEKGTVFELYFPVTRVEVTAEKEDVPLENYLGHGEKILVVDDEERQREIACQMLAKLGYTADAVSSGEEAIEYVKERQTDLIVLDMVMPKGINGREAYEAIIKIRPGQKAVIASGYAKTREVDTAQELGAGKYIKKPYTLEKTGLAVKGELEK